MSSVETEPHAGDTKSNNFSKLSEEIEKILESSRQSPIGTCHKSLNKALAEKYLCSGEETKGIYHLTESHGVSLRLRGMLCRELGKGNMKGGIDERYLSFKNEYTTSPEGMLKRLEELPKEWTIVQLTCGFRVTDRFCRPNQRYPMPDVYITRFPRRAQDGCVEAPYCHRITPPESRDVAMSTPLDEIHLIVQENKIRPRSLLNNRLQYWKARIEIARKMELVMNEVEMSWIGMWRFLFLGRLLDANLQQAIDSFLVQLLADNDLESISSRTKRLICRIIEASEVLTPEEVNKVLIVLVGSKKNGKRLSESILGKFPSLKTAQRQTVLLILDEVLEIVPWENMTILQDHPVARNESLHMLHTLFKAHEDSMDGGFKVLTEDCIGNFVVNPDGNLADMEERMKRFFSKRLPSWHGTYGKMDSESFKSSLTNCDIFLYSGHGNGRQIVSSVIVEQLQVRAVCLLMGCSSANFSSYGGRTELHGMSQSYHIGASPVVLGNLWEVSDFDTDRITVYLLHSWMTLGKGMKEEVSFYLDDDRMKSCEYRHEPELLRALVRSRRPAKFNMTSFAFVARGLPIKIVPSK